MSDQQISVLIVEDNPGDARLLVESLVEAGFSRTRISIASTLASACDRLQSEDVDVILLDLSLPDSHGLATVESVKAVASFTPIVVLTGNGDEAMAVRAVNAGAQDYLIKNDVTSEPLDRAIRYAIERKRTERIERDRASLQEAIRSMNEVLGVVAHELRTPLTSLRMISEVLLTERRLEQKRSEEFLKSIHDEVIRMSDMVSDLLETARLESGAAKWNWSLVRLAKVCADAIAVLAPLTHDAVEIKARVDPPALLCNGDTDAIRRLLINLLTNSLKHTRSGQVIIDVQERSIDGERLIAIKVQDSGSGIPDEIAQQLGRAFALNAGVASPAITRGTGLGLAICKGIVAAHGGTITVASTVGAGTTFTVIFKADLKAAVKSSNEATILREIAA
jgi:signal transduction histidine kinase